MTALEDQFEALDASVRELLDLLHEADETFWSRTFQRALPQIEQRRLSGATFVLGCYGGVDTFSDFVLAPHLEADEPLRFQSLNARLVRLRTQTFEAANAIAARRAW